MSNGPRTLLIQDPGKDGDEKGTRDLAVTAGTLQEVVIHVNTKKTDDLSSHYGGKCSRKGGTLIEPFIKDRPGKGPESDISECDWKYLPHSTC